jgi:hypothetical protein
VANPSARLPVCRSARDGEGDGDLFKGHAQRLGPVRRGQAARSQMLNTGLGAWIGLGGLPCDDCQNLVRTQTVEFRVVAARRERVALDGTRAVVPGTWNENRQCRHEPSSKCTFSFAALSSCTPTVVCVDLFFWTGKGFRLGSVSQSNQQSKSYYLPTRTQPVLRGKGRAGRQAGSDETTAPAARVPRKHEQVFSLQLEVRRLSKYK